MPGLISINDLWLDPRQYPLTLRRLKDGNVRITCALPTSNGPDPMSVQLTFTVSPDDLEKLANAHRGLLGAALACQAWEADTRLHPRGPKRKSARTFTKLFASQDAKQMYPTIKWLTNHPEYQQDWFRKLCEIVRQSSNANPSALEITAWVIEELHKEAFNFEGLRQPTDNVARFARDYLYTDPKMTAYMPYELREIIKKVLPS